MSKPRRLRPRPQVRGQRLDNGWGAWVRWHFDQWSAFCYDNADKLILFGIFLCMILVVLHVTHHAHDEQLISWSREETGTVLGALLGLITGAALHRTKKPH